MPLLRVVYLWSKCIVCHHVYMLQEAEQETSSLRSEEGIDSHLLFTTQRYAVL